MGRRWLVMVCHCMIIPTITLNAYLGLYTGCQIPLASILIVSFAASVLIVFNAFQMSSNGPHPSRHLVDVAGALQAR